MNSDQITFLLGVLEDYSNRYVAWAGFFLASIFGSYTLLSLKIRKKASKLFFMVYLFLFILGSYSLINSLRYVYLTSIITNKIRDSDPQYGEVWNEVFKDFYKKFPLNILHKFDYLFSFPEMTALLLLGFYSFITLIPFIFKFKD